MDKIDPDDRLNDKLHLAVDKAVRAAFSRRGIPMPIVDSHRLDQDVYEYVNYCKRKGWL